MTAAAFKTELINLFKPKPMEIIMTLSSIVCPLIQEAMEKFDLTIEEDGSLYCILIGNEIEVQIVLADDNSYILKVNDNPSHTRVSKEELNHLITVELLIP